VKQSIVPSGNSSMDIGVESTQDETTRTLKTLPEKQRKKVTIEEEPSYQFIDVIN
jgi:hypothetical protein